MNIVHLSPSDPTVSAILKASFPGFNGKRVQAHIHESVAFHGTQWCGGSRRSYVVLRLADMARERVPVEPFLCDSPGHHESFPIPDGCVVVVFCEGYHEGIEIHTPSANLTPALAVRVELTDDERVVLVATRSLKPSYGGISNFRFHEAARCLGITLDRYNTAKQALIARGLLNKAGAITIVGRNAIADMGLASLSSMMYERSRASLEDQS